MVGGLNERRYEQADGAGTGTDRTKSFLLLFFKKEALFYFATR
jgi:hypothetical protein